MSGTVGESIRVVRAVENASLIVALMGDRANDRDLRCGLIEAKMRAARAVHPHVSGGWAGWGGTSKGGAGGRLGTTVRGVQGC